MTGFIMLVIVMAGSSLIHWNHGTSDSFGASAQGRVEPTNPGSTMRARRSRYPFDAILDKKFKQISREVTRKIWQYRVKWLGQADSWEPASLIAAIAPAKTSKLEAQKDAPEQVGNSMKCKITGYISALLDPLQHNQHIELPLISQPSCPQELHNDQRMS